jgi:hypothetical protein
VSINLVTKANIQKAYETKIYYKTTTVILLNLDIFILLHNYDFKFLAVTKSQQQFNVSNEKNNVIETP